MSKFLTSLLLGKHQKALEERVDTYEVDAYVASKRKQRVMQQLRIVLAKPSVLAGIFGVGMTKELLASNDSDCNDSSGFSILQLASLLTRFV